MQNETLNYKWKIAIRNYAMVFGLLLLVFTVSKALGNSTEITLLKLAVVPLFFLSFGGLRSIYRIPIFEHKVTFRAVEYSIIEGLIFSLFLFVLLWHPESTTAELLSLFGVCIITFTLIKLVMLALIVRKISDEKNSIPDS